MNIFVIYGLTIEIKGVALSEYKCIINILKSP